MAEDDGIDSWIAKNSTWSQQEVNRIKSFNELSTHLTGSALSCVAKTSILQARKTLF